MKDLGVNTITIPIYWDQIEKQKGQPDYSEVDHTLELAQKYGMQVKLHPVVWANCYPSWVDKGYDAARQKNSQLTPQQYTEDMVQQHVKKTLNHFGKKFGNEICAVEINEMDSTELLQHAKKDFLGEQIRDKDNRVEYEQVINGITHWIEKFRVGCRNRSSRPVDQTGFAWRRPNNRKGL